MRMLQFEQDVPDERDAEDGDAEVQPDADAVVCVSLRLHCPSHRLPKGLDSTKNTGVMREGRKASGILTHFDSSADFVAFYQ